MKRLDIVDLIQIAKPCPASWDDMAGDDQVRHCCLCKKNVYNLSEMTRDEIQRLIIEREGKFCARVYRRQDGKVMTADCPKGLARVQRRAAAFVLTCAAFFFASGFAIFRSLTQRDMGQTFDYKQVQPFKLLTEWANPPKATPPPTNYPLGVVAPRDFISTGSPVWVKPKGP